MRSLFLFSISNYILGVGGTTNWQVAWETVACTSSILVIVSLQLPVLSVYVLLACNQVRACLWLRDRGSLLPSRRERRGVRPYTAGQWTANYLWIVEPF
jgi:hypothetical protein